MNYDINVTFFVFMCSVVISLCSGQELKMPLYLFIRSFIGFISGT